VRVLSTLRIEVHECLGKRGFAEWGRMADEGQFAAHVRMYVLAALFTFFRAKNMKRHIVCLAKK
jgi:hypothetical protein